MFFTFGIKDAIDILLVAIVLYYVYRFMRDTRTLNMFVGTLLFIVIWLVVSRVLEMKMMGALFDKFVAVGVLAVLILFQKEIRKFLISMGERNNPNSIVGWIARKSKDKDDNTSSHAASMPIVMACINMARNKCGALIVLERNSPLNDIIETGDTIDAAVNQRLIENIFFKNSPLHDGAMIIGNNRIKAAGCILPVSHSHDIPRELGLRHRSAMGISQQSDAIAIVVSEETGRISAAINGNFRLRLSAEELEKIINS